MLSRARARVLCAAFGGARAWSPERPCCRARARTGVLSHGRRRAEALGALSGRAVARARARTRMLSHGRQRSQRGLFLCVLHAAVHRCCAAAAEPWPPPVYRPDGGHGGWLGAAPPGARVASPLRYSLARDRGEAVLCRGRPLCPGCVLVWSLRDFVYWVLCSLLSVPVLPYRLGPPWVVEPPVLPCALCASLCYFPARTHRASQASRDAVSLPKHMSVAAQTPHKLAFFSGPLRPR